MSGARGRERKPARSRSIRRCVASASRFAGGSVLSRRVDGRAAARGARRALSLSLARGAVAVDAFCRTLDALGVAGAAVTFGGVGAAVTLGVAGAAVTLGALGAVVTLGVVGTAVTLGVAGAAVTLGVVVDAEAVPGSVVAIGGAPVAGALGGAVRSASAAPCAGGSLATCDGAFAAVAAWLSAVDAVSFVDGVCIDRAMPESIGRSRP